MGEWATVVTIAVCSNRNLTIQYNLTKYFHILSFPPSREWQIGFKGNKAISGLNERLADGGEAVAVNGRGAMEGQGGFVGAGAVAFVAGKVVIGILAVQGNHVAVAAYLGQDGGGGNGEAFLVAFDDGLLGNGDVFEAHAAVYQ
jgi:hypothetical protein